MVKNSFRSLKRQWLRANNVEGGGACSLLKLIARVKGISNQPWGEKILDAYTDKYHLDPVVLKGLVHQEYLSDEVSGPEDETWETKEAWKVRMAALTDMSLAPAALEKVKFLEVLLPAWHTTIYSDLIHELTRWWDDARSRNRQRTVYYRVYTDRVSHRIPLFTPYNFGFITEWLELHCADREKRNLLKDWGNYPEPNELGLPVSEMIQELWTLDGTRRIGPDRIDAKPASAQCDRPWSGQSLSSTTDIGQALEADLWGPCLPCHGVSVPAHTLSPGPRNTVKHPQL
ncbi:hypothetical protein B0H17DRAFT_1134654 [Mycena rosella]|uniref:Uncharacterized protein n=1 Tax=Mycena rosella TaxID=1033263 RepID=A0AAD7DGU9_MYCRO|nr:hypothetical protein B0H17DRAFT_1134654 [Mycena rosella]